jgi:hypothetical protein
MKIYNTRILLVLLISILSILNSILLFAQNEFKPDACIINYNYQNELRIELPAGEYGWSKYDLEKSFNLLEKYVDFILINLDEIQFEMSLGNPLDIKLYMFGDLKRMDINRSSKPVSYLYKDSALLFTGIHTIYLNDEENPQVRISFDKIEGLQKLSILDFKKIFISLKKDIRDKPIFTKKEFKNTLELMYWHEKDDLMNIGKIDFNKRRAYTIRGTFGIELVPGQIGIAVMPEFGIINYRMSKDGDSYIHNKHTVIWKSTLFQDFTTMGLKYSIMDAYKYKGEYLLFGKAFGIFAGRNNEGFTQYGPTFSILGDYKRLTTDIEIRIPLKNWEDFPFIGVTLGVKF